MPEPKPIEDTLPEIALRIPGVWERPEQLFGGLPEGYRFGPEGLYAPDGRVFYVSPREADEEFAGIFARSCHRTPSKRDRDAIENYKMNVCLAGPGGSYETARRMIDAAAAILHTGGAGVFVDNSGVAHGSDDWLNFTDDPEPIDVHRAYVAAGGNKDEMYSIGMQVLGHRDIIMPRSGDDRADFEALMSILGHICHSADALADGDTLDAPDSPTFRVHNADAPMEIPPGHPMHNPYGQWKLEPIEDGE